MVSYLLTILSQIATHRVFVSVTCSGIFNLKKRGSRDIYLNLRLRSFAAIGPTSNLTLLLGEYSGDDQVPKVRGSEQENNYKTVHRRG